MDILAFFPLKLFCIIYSTDGKRKFQKLIDTKKKQRSETIHLCILCFYYYAF